MSDQQAEHYSAVSEFQLALPAFMAAFTYSGNTTRKAANRRWEAAILQILSGMVLYAKLHETHFNETVGNDGLFGDVLTDMLGGVKTLLLGNMGRLDGSLMDRYLREFAAKNDLQYPE